MSDKRRQLHRAISRMDEAGIENVFWMLSLEGLI